MDNKKLWALHNPTNGHWLYIWASSFDKALAAARKIEPGYNGGQVLDEKYWSLIIADIETD